MKVSARNCYLWVVSMYLFLSLTHRYLRMSDSFFWIGEFVYILGPVLGLLSFIYWISKEHTFNNVDIFITLFFFSVLIVFVKLGFEKGWVDQARFFAFFVAPLVSYWFFRVSPIIDKIFVIRSMHLGLLLTSSLLIAEFVGQNLLHVDFFGFNHYVASETSGFARGYRFPTTYSLLGDFRTGRPWGFMALPQTTGSVIGALVVFFFAQKNTSKYWISVLLGIIAVYLSGSKTAYIVTTLLICLLVVYRVKPVHRPFFTGALFCAAMLLLGFTLNFADPGKVFWRFYGSVDNFFRYILMEDVIDHLLGEYRPGRNEPNLVDQMFGQGVESKNNILAGMGEVHILNAVLQVGLVAALVWLISTLGVMLNIIKRVVCNDEDSDLHLGLLLFFIAIFLSSMHYMVLVRFPVSVVIVMLVAFVARDLSVRSTVERLQK